MACLKDDDRTTSAVIYVSPPDNYLNSDEDSGGEDDLNVNHLSGSQLRAQAEATVTRITEAGVEEVQLGVEDNLDMTMDVEASEDVSTSNVTVATDGSQVLCLPSTSSTVLSDANDCADVNANSACTKDKITAHVVEPQMPHVSHQNTSSAVVMGDI